MRYFGFADATTTINGADGGIDVDSSLAVAQVKAHMVPISRPDLQRLLGAAVTVNKRPLFFSLMSYTKDALAWANEVSMPLFRFDHSGQPEPVNDWARQLVDQSSVAQQHISRAHTGPAAPIPAFALVASDELLRAAAERSRQGRGRNKEQLLALVQVWLPLQVIGIDFSSSHRGTLRHHSAGAYFRSARWHPLCRQRSSSDGRAGIVNPCHHRRGRGFRCHQPIERRSTVIPTGAQA